MGQFPSDRPKYQIIVNFWNKDEFLLEVDLGLTTATGVDISDLKLPAGTTRLGIYLLDPQNIGGDPLYFDFFGDASEETAFASFYWLDYIGYFNIVPRDIRYGISEQAVRMVPDLPDLNLDFRRAPYFLYLSPNSGGSLVTASYASVGSGVWASFGDSMEAILDAQQSVWSSSYKTSGTLSSRETPLYLIVEPQDYSVDTSATVSFDETSRISIADTISCLVPTDQPNVVYAVTETSHSLYLVDPLAKSATLVCQFPIQSVDGMAYSAIDQKLYGYTRNSGTLLVYDIAQNTSQTMVYDSTETGSGIAISPSERRLYLGAGDHYGSKTLYILDLDTLAVLSSGALGSSDGDIAYSPAEKAILHSDSYVIKKYSVANDLIVNSGVSYDSTQYYGDNGFALNPAGSQLVYANIGTGYFVRTIDTKTMQVAGTWNIGAYPRRSIFTSDGRSIVASIGDGKVYKSLANDFSQVTTYVFPPTYFVVNSDNTRLIGFSQSEKSFYLLDVSEDSPSVPSSGSWSSLRMTSSSSPKVEFSRRDRAPSVVEPLP